MNILSINNWIGSLSRFGGELRNSDLSPTMKSRDRDRQIEIEISKQIDRKDDAKKLDEALTYVHTSVFRNFSRGRIFFLVPL